MAAYLNPQARCAAVGEDVVFLDLAADRYLCLPGAAGSPGPWRDGPDAPVEPALAPALCEAGLASDPCWPRPPPDPVPPRPARSLDPEPRPRFAARDAGDLILASLDLFRSYRGRPLAELVELARAGRPAAARGDEAGAADLARRFHGWAPFAPASAKCLLRAFMLLRLLQRSGFDPRWVFGVRTYPFAAHCWLQLGDLVLDDHWDRLAPYEPILAV